MGACCGWWELTVAEAVRPRGRGWGGAGAVTLVSLVHTVKLGRHRPTHGVARLARWVRGIC